MRQEREVRRLSLTDLLAKPFQRIPRYRLLLQVCSPLHSLNQSVNISATPGGNRAEPWGLCVAEESWKRNPWTCCENLNYWKRKQWTGGNLFSNGFNFRSGIITFLFFDITFFKIRQQQLRQLEMMIHGLSHNDLVSPSRSLLRHDLVTTSTSPWIRKDRCLFLFNDIVIITSVSRRGAKDIKRTISS